MKGSTKRALSILIATLLFLATLGIYVSLIKPAYQDIDQARGQLFTKSSQLSDYKNTISQMKTLLAQYDNLSQAQQSVSLMLPNQPSIPEALFQINGIAGVSGLSLQSLSVKELAITPSASILVKGMTTLRFSTKLTGTYESLKTFLQNLNANIRIFNINTIKVEKLGVTPNLFNFNIDINAYYQAK